MENIYKFEENLLALSESDDRQEAIDEWSFVNYRLGDKDTKLRCVCGHIFWSEINVYCNERNGNTIHAGSECDKRFKDIQRRGRGTKNELLRGFMSLEKGVYENIYDHIAYSIGVRDRLCTHIESQISAFNSVGLEKLLHGIEAIIAGLESKNRPTGDLDRFIPMIQAAMAGARVTEEAARVQREADRVRHETAQRAKEEADRIYKEMGASQARAAAERRYAQRMRLEANERDEQERIQSLARAAAETATEELKRKELLNKVASEKMIAEKARAAVVRARAAEKAQITKALRSYRENFRKKIVANMQDINAALGLPSPNLS